MNNIISLLFPFILMIGLMYLMVFRPESKRKKQYQSMLDGLSVNDEIMTRGGILGRVINISDDYVIIESGPDRVRLKFTKTAIGDVLTKKEEPAKEN
ncbi:MAG: preprotein translocase subunit YajC [Clostridium sp.]|uniref:preprotein translocase subunit YajC n=1 Tax=Clostridium sp. TaxID=1506 RepID=UPI002A89291A|nr:preprotein translocase subunit YajC [Clostridium sp.]MDY5097994.1 preprotein translocase subunit YajC [Clostridium sp.]